MTFTRVYGSPRASIRRELWEELRLVAQNNSSPWLLAGDFNALLNDSDKQGGSCLGGSSCKLFRNFFADYCLKEVSFQGSNFTCNRGFVYERLDRAICNYR